MSNTVLIIGEKTVNKHSRTPQSFKYINKKDKVLNLLKNRFYEKVLLPNENGCMEWNASLRDFGYGAFTDSNKKSIKAHRFSYKLFNGEIPDKKIILHKCDNPKCVAPDHLYAGTYKNNYKDMVDRKRNSNPPVRIGEKNNLSKLTEIKVEKIVLLINQKISSYRIGKIFNVDKRLIDFIKQGKIWKHITKDKITNKCKKGSI